MSAVTLSSPLPFLPYPHARLLFYPEAFFSRPRASFARERGRETETLLCPGRDCGIVYWQRGRENKRQRKREGVGRERMRKGERERERGGGGGGKGRDRKRRLFVYGSRNCIASRSFRLLSVRIMRRMQIRAYGKPTVHVDARSRQ